MIISNEIQRCQWAFVHKTTRTNHLLHKYWKKFRSVSNISNGLRHISQGLNKFFSLSGNSNCKHSNQQLAAKTFMALIVSCWCCERYLLVWRHDFLVSYVSDGNLMWLLPVLLAFLVWLSSPHFMFDDLFSAGTCLIFLAFLWDLSSSKYSNTLLAHTRR